MIKVKDSNKGFTLIELLLVVTMIAILAGIVVNIIDTGGAQDKAEIAVVLSNLEKAVTGVETYYAAEGSYPVESAPLNGTFNNEINVASPTHPLANYISHWPHNEPATGFVYTYYNNNGIVIWVTDGIGDCFKYNSNWGEIRHCTLASCTGGMGAMATCNAPASPIL